MNNEIRRSLLAASVMSLLTALYYLAVGSKFFIPAAVVFFSLFIWHLLLAMVIRQQWRTWLKTFAVILTSYFVGLSLVGVGGLLWQISEYGLKRTNVAGYLAWAPVYGIVFLAMTAPVTWWVFHRLFTGPESLRGFDVVLIRRSQET